MNKCKSLIGTLIIVGFIFSTISTGYCEAGYLYSDVSGRLLGNLKVQAVTGANESFQPIDIHNGDTYTGHTKFTDQIPLEAKYKTIKFSQHWVGTPKDVGGQIDVYTGGDIYFQAPLTWKIGSKGASSVSIRYNNVTCSSGAGAWVRWTPY
ncbi:MAG: hypothetical protein LBD03_02050 [Methanobrevibacter sp.]|jgi:hypothetical protein|nr:hypothetical protein [Candidatus Methanovirga procula]